MNNETKDDSESDDTRLSDAELESITAIQYPAAAGSLAVFVREGWRAQRVYGPPNEFVDSETSYVALLLRV